MNHSLITLKAHKLIFVDLQAVRASGQVLNLDDLISPQYTWNLCMTQSRLILAWDGIDEIIILDIDELAKKDSESSNLVVHFSNDIVVWKFREPHRSPLTVGAETQAIIQPPQAK